MKKNKRKTTKCKKTQTIEIKKYKQLKQNRKHKHLK